MIGNLSGTGRGLSPTSYQVKKKTYFIGLRFLQNSSNQGLHMKVLKVVGKFKT